jgi:hypothetical protein
MTASLYSVLRDSFWSPQAFTITTTITHLFQFSQHMNNREKLKDLFSVQLSCKCEPEMSVTVTDVKMMILLERLSLPFRPSPSALQASNCPMSMTNGGEIPS